MKPRHRPDDVKAAIVTALVSAGAFVVDVESPAPGAPDLAALWTGSTTWLELKSRKGKPSLEQLAWHDRAARAGVRVHVVRTTREALEAIGVVGPRAEENRKAMQQLADQRHPGQAATRTLRPAVRRND